MWTLSSDISSMVLGNQRPAELVLPRKIPPSSDPFSTIAIVGLKEVDEKLAKKAAAALPEIPPPTTTTSTSRRGASSSF